MKLRDAAPAHETEGSRTGVASPGRTSLVQFALEGAGTTPGPQPRGVELPTGGGRTLPDEVRIAMQRAFGYDFSSVRIHEGPEPQAMGAIAFARGTDLFFRPGAYDPTSETGRRLLAHELAHVVQQALGRVAPTGQHGGVGMNTDASLESEADHLADRALAHRPTPGEPEPAPKPLPSGGATMQRKIGMEFETTLPIEKGGEYHANLYKVEGVNWKITDDGGKVEFVTSPLRTREELIGAVQQIHRFIESAKKLLASGGFVAVADIVRDAELPQGGVGRVGGMGFDVAMLAAKPQVSVGVPLDHVAQLFASARHLKLTEYDTQIDEQKAKPDAVKGHTLATDETSLAFEVPAKVDSVQVALEWGERMKQAHRDIRPDEIDNAVGVMTMILKYLNDAHFKPFSGKPEYAKAYFPVMARTHFTAMFDHVGKKAAQLFTVDEIIACWGQTSSHILLNTKMLPLGFEDADVKNPQIPTIGDWLESIVDKRKNAKDIGRKYAESDKRLAEHYASGGDDEMRRGVAGARKKDLMSRGDIALNSTSMGLLDMDTKEEAVPLVVLEFRQFPSDTSLHPEYWERLADRLYTFYEEASGKKQSATETLQHVQWGKDILGLLRASVRERTNELQHTNDDQFNGKALKLQRDTLVELGKLDPSQHEAITKIAAAFAKAAQALDTERAAHKRTGAISLPKGRAQAQLGDRFPGSFKWSEMRQFLTKMFTGALDSIRIPLDAVEKHNLAVDKAKADYAYGQGGYEWYEFVNEQAETIAKLEDDKAKARTGNGLADLEAREQQLRGLIDVTGWREVGPPLIEATRRRRSQEPSYVVLRNDITALRDQLTELIDPVKDRDTLRVAIDKFTSDYKLLRARFLEEEPKFKADTTSKLKPLDDGIMGGNCLFDATAAVFANGTAAKQLREDTAAEVRARPLAYVDRLVGDHADIMAAMRAAADYIAVEGNWAAEYGELAPLALARVVSRLGRRLVILNPNGTRRYEGPGDGADLCIFYNGWNHYTASA